jgi:intein/homing endonuclease
MIKEKLTPEDKALAIIMHDPVLFCEFMRNTKDAHSNTELWPKKPFKYRNYQVDLLTDQHPYISLIGGRSIGKCQIGTDYIYTTEGYVKIRDLYGKAFFIYAYNEQRRQLEIERGYVAMNGIRGTYKLITETGLVITGTPNHPVLTDEGWNTLDRVQVGDHVFRTKKLPHIISHSVQHYEARLLGYMLFERKKQMIKIPQHFTTIAAAKDFQKCLEQLGGRAKFVDERTVSLLVVRTKKLKFHPLTELFHDFGTWRSWNSGWLPERGRYIRIPKKITCFNEENLRSFLEGILSRYATITKDSIEIPIPSSAPARQLQELFLRFGIYFIVQDTEKTETYYSEKRNVKLVAHTYEDVYTTLKTFDIPGVLVHDIQEPETTTDDFIKERVLFCEPTGVAQTTYVVQVNKIHTYLSSHFVQHNSLVLEDKMLFDIIDHRRTLVETPELLLATANMSQMTPLLNRLQSRFMSSPFLKTFVEKNLNKFEGTMGFKVDDRPIKLFARIAGQSTETNMIGLHVARIRIDESQVFNLAAYRQLTPALNTWQPNHSMFTAGVSNGVINSTLYQLDQRTARFKKYRIPATNNPFFTYKDFEQAKKDYGGEESDLFQNLVLGRHGKGSEQVISRDDIQVENFSFYREQLTHSDLDKGYTYQSKLTLHKLDYELFYAGIDTGYVDPTIISVFGLKNGKWYFVARYRLQRIEYPMQEEIINYLHEHYHFARIMIDIGSAGSSIYQGLLGRDQYKSKKYKDITTPVQFGERIPVGTDEFGREIIRDTKTVGADELVRFLQAKQIVLSEVDTECISEVERIAKQKNLNGQDRYFILSEQGKGASKNDHIFASLICFCIGIRDMSFLRKKKKKLGRSIG